MHRSKKTLRYLAAGAAAACLSLGAGATAASAAPATFNAPNGTGVTVSGSLTVGNGSTTTVCTINITGSVSNSGSPSQGLLQANMGLAWSSCTTGLPLQFVIGALASKSGSTFSLGNVISSGVLRNPFGTPPNEYYTPQSYTAAFTNGSGATPSRITYSNTTFSTAGTSLRATGTLNVTRTNGSLITLL